MIEYAGAAVRAPEGYRIWNHLENNTRVDEAGRS
jgi:hypothetical protein